MNDCNSFKKEYHYYLYTRDCHPPTKVVTVSAPWAFGRRVDEPLSIIISS